MTLLSGQLYLGVTVSTNRNIRNEITGAEGAYTLSAAIAAKQGTPATRMTNFNGYTHYTVPTGAPTGLTNPYDDDSPSAGQGTFNLAWTKWNGHSAGPPTNIPTLTYVDYKITSGGSWQINQFNVSYTTQTFAHIITCGTQDYFHRVRHWNPAGFEGYSNEAGPTSSVCCLLGNHSLMVEANVFKNVKEIRIGDYLNTSHQDKPREIDYYRVYAVAKVPVESYHLLRFENGEEIRCSKTHKFMCVGGPRPIEDILVGDKVMQFKNDEMVELRMDTKIEIIENEIVYKIEVEGAHTYITENGILQHNIKE